MARATADVRNVGAGHEPFLDPRNGDDDLDEGHVVHRGALLRLPLR